MAKFEVSSTQRWTLRKPEQSRRGKPEKLRPAARSPWTPFSRHAVCPHLDPPKQRGRAASFGRPRGLGAKGGPRAFLVHHVPGATRGSGRRQTAELPVSTLPSRWSFRTQPGEGCRQLLCPREMVHARNLSTLSCTAFSAVSFARRPISGSGGTGVDPKPREASNSREEITARLLTSGLRAARLQARHAGPDAVWVRAA